MKPICPDRPHPSVRPGHFPVLGILFFGLAGFVMLGLATGCRKADRTAAVPAKPRVALIMKSLANEFFGTMAEGARAHHAAHAADYDLLVNGIKNETDLSEQVSLVEQAIAKRCDAIVIAPADSKALVPALKRAFAAGIIVINIDNRLDAAAIKDAGLAIPFVGPDNRTGAAAVGRIVATRLSAGAPVAIIEGLTTADNGRQRRLGFEDAIKEAGLKLVSTQSGQWEMERANTIAASLLNAHADLKAIFCANDNMALGAVAAIKAAGREGQVLVAGFDHIKAIQPLLQSGIVIATADQHADRLAVYGIEAALDALKTKQTADRATPVDVITR
jgi:ribose transport system substrate-binding protein